MRTILKIIPVALTLLVSGCGSGEKTTPDNGTKYTCSMHPQVMQDEPGPCPLCAMDLVPVKKSTPGQARTPDPHAGHEMEDVKSPSEQEHPTVHLESAKASVLSAKTVVAQQRSLIREIQVFGQMRPVADREVMFNWYYNGRVDEVLVDFNTTEVEKGQPLLKVYSEEAIADQEMLLKLMRERWLRTFYERKNLTTQIDAVAVRLRQAGMTPEQIEHLKNKQTIKEFFTIRAPVDGSLIGELPHMGMRFKANDTILHIAPLEEIWFVAEVFEKDMAYVKLGQKLRVESKALPDKSAVGAVVYRDRILDSETRTVEVRVRVPNPDLTFLPNLSAVGTLQAPLGEVDVAIPPSALIETGTRQVVYVEAAPGHYEQRRVETGVQTEDWVEIKSGVQAGERVVTEGAFLIDAEAQLLGQGGQ